MQMRFLHHKKGINSLEGSGQPFNENSQLLGYCHSNSLLISSAWFFLSGKMQIYMMLCPSTGQSIGPSFMFSNVKKLHNQYISHPIFNSNHPLKDIYLIFFKFKQIQENSWHFNTVGRVSALLLTCTQLYELICHLACWLVDQLVRLSIMLWRSLPKIFQNRNTDPNNLQTLMLLLMSYGLVKVIAFNQTKPNLVKSCKLAVNLLNFPWFITVLAVSEKGLTDGLMDLGADRQSLFRKRLKEVTPQFPRLQWRKRLNIVCRVFTTDYI